LSFLQSSALSCVPRYAFLLKALSMLLICSAVKAVRGLLPDGGEAGEVEAQSAGADGEKERPPSLSYPEVSSSVPLLKSASVTADKEEISVNMEPEKYFKYS
ncbi:hypothetical protein E3U43_005644, partial [Larimichthys crocea]